MGGVLLDLASELADVDVEVVLVGAFLAAPDALEEHAVGEDAVGVHDEGLEELVLGGGEVDGLAGASDLAALEVDGEVAGAEDGLGAGGGAGGVAEGDADAGDELVHAEGLGEVVIGAEGEGLDLGGFGVSGGEDNDGGGANLADAADDLDAVEVGEAKVEEDDVGGALAEGIEGVAGGAGDLDVVAVAGEAAAEGLDNLGVVFDDEDAGAFRRHALPRRARRDGGGE